jgi:hypothetical protein
MTYFSQENDKISLTCKQIKFEAFFQCFGRYASKKDNTEDKERI